MNYLKSHGQKSSQKWFFSDKKKHFFYEKVNKFIKIFLEIIEHYRTHIAKTQNVTPTVVSIDTVQFFICIAKINITDSDNVLTRYQVFIYYEKTKIFERNATM